jgi:hypothetical protein
MPFCVQCGERAKPSDVFCWQCGSRQSTNEKINRDVYADKRTRLGRADHLPMEPVPIVTQGIGINFRWIFAVGAAFIFLAAVVAAMMNIEKLWRDWSWGFLLSPSAWAFSATLYMTIALPITMIRKDYRMGFLESLFTLLILVVWFFVCQFILWGSFPLIHDPDGTQRIRMIPFIPWPNRSFF